MTSPIFLCFTGGPGAGKTESLARLSQSLRRQGRVVFVVPEVATLFINAGTKPWEMSRAEHFNFQVSHVSTQDSLERAAARILGGRAAGAPRAIVLCDRGLMDGSAYFGSDGWDEVLSTIGTTSREVVTRRYHSVIHLESSACLSADAYPGSTNPARWQDAGGARASDRRLREVWSEHPRHLVIRARPLFDDKLSELERIVEDLIQKVK